MLAIMSAYMAFSPLSVHAQTTNITIKAHENQSIVGKKFIVHALFTAEDSEAKDSIRYTVNPVYETLLQGVVKAQKKVDTITNDDVIDYISDLKDGKDFRLFVKAVMDEITKQKIPGTEHVVNEVDVNGNYTIANLPYGYYAIQDASDVQGKHGAVSLTMVTTSKPNAEIEIKQDYPQIIKKVFEDDEKVGWNDIADYNIGQEVPFSYQTNVPNMDGYETYVFKIHDEMHEALSFLKETMNIQIKGAQKTYSLSKNEFVIELYEGSFTVQIKNLKSIVEREFGTEKGQEVIYNYKMELNEKAANNTGRPGYENKVRLEYSNNPYTDGTGMTPWDTNVVFTYKIKVDKVNDDQKALKDAQFKLYADKECTQEVWVKQSGKNFIPTTKPSETQTMVSDGSGHFEIVGLDQGTYYLKETKAPKGYRLLLQPIELKIQPTFQADRQNYIAGNNQALSKLEVHSQDILLESDIEDGSSNLQVVNTKQPELPFTGSSSTLIYVGAGCILIGVSCLKRRKH